MTFGVVSTRFRVLAAVTLGHFAIDIFNSMGPVLLAFLQSPLGLDAAQIGLAAGLYQFLAGSTQPLFGALVDRVGSRLLGPLSVAVTLTCICLAIAMALRTGSFPLFLGLFAFAAIGSGAFHPQGTMHAGTPESGRAATTTAVFFLFGQLGLASGPFLAGLSLDRFGAPGIYGLALIVSVVPIGMVLAMGSRRFNPPPERLSLAEPAQKVAPRTHPISRRSGSLVLTLLAAVFACRAWVFIGTASFLPLLFQGRGWSSTGQGMVTGLFWLGGGLTGVAAGAVADRWGRRLVVVASTLAGSSVLWFLPTADGGLALLLAILCGALLGAPHSVLMVMAQSLLPVRKGLASGAALGFLFASGALASLVIGVLADRLGLAQVLQGGAVVGVAAGVLAGFLPSSSAEAERLATVS